MELTDEELEYILQDPDKRKYFLDLLEKTKSEKSLLAYSEYIWPILHGPDQPMVTNWATEAVCEHLEWVLSGDIKNLMIEIPPRMSKPVYEEEYVTCKTGFKKLKDVKVGDYVLSHTGKYNEVTAVHVQGKLPCKKIYTSKNTELITAYDHPILTNDGWVETQNLKPDESVIISSQQIEDFDGQDSKKDKSILNTFYYLLLKAINKKSIDKSIKSKVKNELKSNGVSGANFLNIINNYLNDINFNDSLDDYLTLIGSLNSFEIKNIITTYWKDNGEFDKNVSYPNQNSIKFIFNNENSVKIFKALLSRLGIYSFISIYPSTLKELHENVYKLIIKNKQDIYLFKKLIDHPTGIYKINGYTKNVKHEFRTNYRNEPVTKIETVGELPCRCLTVANDSSFVVNNISVHNSLLTSVAFPTWVWGPMKAPYKKFLLTSYGLKLSTDALRKVKRVLKSQEYKKHWGEDFTLDIDNAELIANSENGQMNALAAVTGMTTGLTGNINIADDLLKAGQKYTEEYYQKVYEWYVSAFINRLADVNKDSNIIIAQRLDSRDPLGKLIDSGQNYVRLTLPMEFIPERRCYTVNNWKDPRIEEGELLSPKRFNEEWVKEKKMALKGTNQWAAQYLQDPSLSTETKFKPEYFVKTVLSDQVKIVSKVRAWDLAASVGNDRDWTVGLLLGVTKSKDIYILNIKRFQAEPAKRNQWIREIAKKDGRGTPICIPQDPHAGGKEVALYLKEYLKGFNVNIMLARGANKETKQEILGTFAAEKRIYMKSDVSEEVKWNDIFLDEALKAPNGKHDDQLDALYDAYKYLMDNTKSKIRKLLAI